MSKPEEIKQIKVTRGCGASGKSLVAGKVYTVPEQVSEADARLLIVLGKAVAFVKPEKSAGKADDKPTDPPAGGDSSQGA